MRGPKDPKFRVVASEQSGSYHMLAVNVTAPPTDNEKARQKANIQGLRPPGNTPLLLVDAWTG